jgi:nitroimidazol reductase NimA-like FMN-containing flavoprotein (pyridoxamine 5'-phosphate oxidase superfamily)
MSNLEMNHEHLTATQRTQVKRMPERSNYERQVVYDILDEALVCHIGFVVDNQPFVIPTTYGRIEDRLYIHGSPASRMLRSLLTGIEVCVTVTLLDGLVLARSALHHSMNYRSVVIFGTANLVQDPAQKLQALQGFTEHIVPGRWAEVRQPNTREIQGTLILSVPLTEASVKIRTGLPLDDELDYGLPVWAGILPLQLTPKEAVTDSRVQPGLTVPDYVKNYTRVNYR